MCQRCRKMGYGVHTAFCQIGLWHHNVVTVLIVDLLVFVVGLLLGVSKQLNNVEH